MKTIIIAYASMSGNTEKMADYIAEGIREEGYEVELKSSLRTSVKDLLKYEGILLGAYSWGGVPDEFIGLYNELAEVDLNGKKAAAFGSGDSKYRNHFGIAVNLINEKLQERGAEVILEGLKMNLAPEGNDIERCKDFGRQFVKKLNQEKQAEKSL
ncbi:MAG: flavodoxin [Bacillota bacterium]|nr:flavodoxin [Bacillota bacterium]